MKDGYLITSNRDEKLSRKMAQVPAMHIYNDQTLFFPKDTDAGGTWIVMKENGDSAVLLNGAFIFHESVPPYRSSRGIVLLDIIASKKASIAFAKINLQGIEPFTFVLLEEHCLYEFRWDGVEKYCKLLNTNQPRIWSSATLFDGFAAKKREKWFSNFLRLDPEPNQDDILQFHYFTGDKKNDMLMTSHGKYRTVSITSIYLTRDRGCIKYLDILNNTSSEIKIGLLPSPHTIE